MTQVRAETSIDLLLNLSATLDPPDPSVGLFQGEYIDHTVESIIFSEHYRDNEGYSRWRDITLPLPETVKEWFLETFRADIEGAEYE